MKTIMITAPSSNTGKTILTLGIIRAIRNRKLDISAFKTGPDFIDTKYLATASGKRAGNLDMHLMGRNGMEKSLGMNLGEYAVVEGAMGYFDGIYNTFENSSFHISKKLDIPAILVYKPEGEMFSAIPKIKGMVDFPGSKIEGIILNKVSKDMYNLFKEKIEEYIDIKVLGFLPHDENLEVESRYLGLAQKHEDSDLEELISKTAELVETTIDIGGILKMAKAIKFPEYKYGEKRDIKVAIAYDEAFNFYYNENLKLLENICNVKYFSPIKDENLPESDLIIFGGGYPELYSKELSENKTMIKSIKEAVESEKYIIGEGGGFMYLNSSIENYPMTNIFQGKATMTNRLQRFGYVNIEFNEDLIIGKKGSLIKGNEYHRSIVDIDQKSVFNIKKPMGKRSWKCGYRYKNVLAYYQHINFLGNMDSFNYLLDKIEEEKRGKMYIKNPMAIENKSMDIIDEVMGDTNFSEEEMIIAKRMIHTTGDFDYRKIISFHKNFIEVAKKEIGKGTTIFTDTKMVYMGINKPALENANCQLKCFIDDERVFSMSKELETTRSACAVDLAVAEGVEIFVIGNAPTALFRVLELVKEGKINPKFVIGVPVGFVGAAESKEYLREFDIPSISTVGNKGGSNVAASIVNALLYMVVGR